MGINPKEKGEEEKMNLKILKVLVITTALILTLACIPHRSNAATTNLVWLTHWTEVSEVEYWLGENNPLKEYEDLTGVHVEMQSVDFENFFTEIMLRHTAGNDPDMIHVNAMWIPELVATANMLAEPPKYIQDDVKANFTAPTVAGSTYLYKIWGYPTEFESWALVYNKKLLAEAGYSQPPKTWDELKTIANATTKWENGVLTQTGFSPFVEGMPEEQRWQFMSWLWSNGGEYLDLGTPAVRFNSTQGLEVMKLLYDLEFVYKTFDPVNFGEGGAYWFDGWAVENIAMMVLPTWMSYIRDAMNWTGPDNQGWFTDIGIAPIPVGPHGTKSQSVVYNWDNVVTKKSEADGRATEAWKFLQWLNSPRSSLGRGHIPAGGSVSRMGDYLIMDSIVPSRTSDQALPFLANDLWFQGFINMGKAPQGRADRYFTTSEEVQAEIGVMFENVITLGRDPATEVAAAASRIQPLLPTGEALRGDLNDDSKVDILDVFTAAKAFGTKLGDPRWEALADANGDNRVDILDIFIIAKNFGKKL
jgi:multiple sugar transport system substrate-binding protein